MCTIYMQCLQWSEEGRRTSETRITVGLRPHPHMGAANWTLVLFAWTARALNNWAFSQSNIDAHLSSWLFSGFGTPKIWHPNQLASPLLPRLLYTAPVVSHKSLKALLRMNENSPDLSCRPIYIYIYIVLQHLLWTTLGRTRFVGA